MICVFFDDQISIFLFKTNTKTLFFYLMIVGFFFSTLIELEEK